MSTFNFFSYGTLMGTEQDASSPIHGCRQIASGFVAGTLYDIDGDYTALMLYGATRVDGVIYECPASLLARLDGYENVSDGLFRRIATNVFTDSNEHVPCWLYVAGPTLAHRLTPQARLTNG